MLDTVQLSMDAESETLLRPANNLQKNKPISSEFLVASYPAPFHDLVDLWSARKASLTLRWSPGDLKHASIY